MDVRHRVSGDLSKTHAVPCPAQRVRANDDSGVMIDDDGPVGQRLRFSRINITADYPLDESFFVVWFVGIETGDESDIKNTSKRGGVVIVLGCNPFLFEV